MICLCVTRVQRSGNHPLLSRRRARHFVGGVCLFFSPAAVSIAAAQEHISIFAFFFKQVGKWSLLCMKWAFDGETKTQIDLKALCALLSRTQWSS